MHECPTFGSYYLFHLFSNKVVHFPFFWCWLLNVAPVNSRQVRILEAKQFFHRTVTWRLRGIPFFVCFITLQYELNGETAWSFWQINRLINHTPRRKIHFSFPLLLGLCLDMTTRVTTTVSPNAPQVTRQVSAWGTGTRGIRGPAEVAELCFSNARPFCFINTQDSSEMQLYSRAGWYGWTAFVTQNTVFVKCMKWLCKSWLIDWLSVLWCRSSDSPLVFLWSAGGLGEQPFMWQSERLQLRLLAGAQVMTEGRFWRWGGGGACMQSVTQVK